MRTNVSLSASEIARFLQKQIRRGDDECWDWSASLCPGTGYGQGFHPRKSGRKCRKYFAHRLSYEIAYGPIPEGRIVLHKPGCKSKACTNPLHLRLGTPIENAADAKIDGRSNRPALTPQDVAAAIAERKQGATYAKLAARFGVSHQTVANLFQGRTYSRLTGITSRAKA